MLPEAHVFIATSLDGFIADAQGGVDWLVTLPVTEGEDHGYAAFMAGVDGLLMGSGSFRSVLTFPEWLYDKPVTVLSRSLTTADIPAALRDRVDLLDTTPREALQTLGARGIRRVYLDGGQVISSFLREGLVQRLTITRVPVLLGRGLPLFADTGPLTLRHVETRSFPHGFVQSTYET
jgi:Dihydrofolate reductase